MKKLLCISVVLLFLMGMMSCKPKSKEESKVDGMEESVELNEAAIGAGKIDQNDTLPGKKVEQAYADKQSRIVCFYKVDENGQLTDEKYREVYYYDSTHYKYTEGNVVDQTKRDGDWFAYHKNGNLCTEAHYVDGKEEGLYKVYHDNGYLYYAGNYRHGLKIGEWKFFDENGKLIYKYFFNDEGQLIKTELAKKNQNNNN